MDQRDFQILLELGRQPFASHRALGSALGVSGTAVKRRIERMEHARVLNGFYVMPAARAFGRYWQVFPFEDVEHEPDPRKLLEIESVVNIWRGRPRTYMVNVYAGSVQDPAPPRLARTLGRRPSGVVLPEPPDKPGFPERILSPLDWRVIDALLDRPRASLAELSERTRLSPRTVRRRRDSLLSRGLLSILPNFDTTREAGLLIYSGFVVAESDRDLDRLLRPSIAILHRLHRPVSAWIFGYTKSYAELQELEDSLRHSPGITRVDLVPSRGGVVANFRFHGWIADQLAWWKSRPTG